jgi:hypothetical protein
MLPANPDGLSRLEIVSWARSRGAVFSKGFLSQSLVPGALRPAMIFHGAQNRILFGYLTRMVGCG